MLATTINAAGSEAKIYWKRLDAPVKRFYSFEHSTHSPLFEDEGGSSMDFDV